MFSSKSLAGITIFSSRFKDPSLPTSRSRSSLVSCSLGTQKIPLEPLKHQSQSESSSKNGHDFTVDKEVHAKKKGISGIHVPRQKYIAISKVELVDAILSMFESKEDADQFLRFSRCLDSILHAEHKSMLEEMRVYYLLTYLQGGKESSGFSSTRSEDSKPNGNVLACDDSLSTGNNRINCHRNDQDDEMLNFHDSLDLQSLFGSCTDTVSKHAVTQSRVAVATHFQRAFMQLLHDAQFEELSAQDLLLTYALNNDYLLTLPIYVDWRKASYSNAIIFKRGYATERQKGLLIVEKLDYLQSKLLQEIFFNLSKPLKRIGSWLNEALKNSSNSRDMQVWIENTKLWLKEKFSPESTLSYIERMSGNQVESDQIAESDLPIWLAAQKAIPRYEGFLSSVGPRGRLIRKLLTWIGIIPSMPETSLNLDKGTENSETYMRPNFLPRITLSNIWEPASRESCGNSTWKMFRSAISILFSQSVLQEPAFQELILLYSEEIKQREIDGNAEVMPVQLKIYERIPIPDLPVIFPHKKLSFRILDTVRLDVASILGLLAFFVNYKFESIASSPSAILLDVIAITALVIYVCRVVLGYKQTRDRYQNIFQSECCNYPSINASGLNSFFTIVNSFCPDWHSLAQRIIISDDCTSESMPFIQLLVNKTLYEKTLASGFGSVHFLLDASEQQQFKEAILVYAVLLNSDNYQVSSRKSIGDACERFMHDKFKEKIEMPIDKALDTLLRLNLVTEFPLEGNLQLKAVPCSSAWENLKKRWDSLLGQRT